MKPNALFLMLLLAIGQATYAQVAKKANPTRKTKFGIVTPVVKEGGVAYIRIKRYFAKTDSVPPADLGKGYDLKSLSGKIQLDGDVSDKVGYELRDMSQTTTETTIEFHFGEAVTLVRKNNAVPVFWFVSDGQTEVWVPAYILTANKSEINFLKANHRIPETMSFIYGEGPSVWGINTHPLFDDNLVFYSMGMSIFDYKKGTSPVAFRGNAVAFDAAGAKTVSEFDKPLLFSRARKFRPSPRCLYYCVSEGNNPTFECIDLVALKIIK